MSAPGSKITRAQRQKMKRKQKEYIRKERESVKRQKRELRAKKQARRRKMIRAQGGWFRYLLRALTGTLVSPAAPKIKAQEKLIEPDAHHKKQNEENDQGARRANQEQRKAEFVRKEKRSIKKNEKALKRHKKLMRKRLRQDRNRYFRKQFNDFFKSPFRRKKIKREHKILRQHIKEEIRRERKQYLNTLPQRISANISRNISGRRHRMVYALRNLRDMLGQFGRFLQMRELRRDVFISMINSTFLFIAAFFIMYFGNKLITILTAQFFDIPAVLYSYRIFWPLYTYSSLYTRLALIVIFAMGPIFSLAASFGLYRVYMWIRKYPLNLKTLVLWMAFHGFNLFFGAYISGVITRTGFVYTTEWLFYSHVFDVEEIIFMIVSIITLIIIGYFMTKQFISSATSVRMIDPKTRLYFIVGKVLLPWLFGTGVLFLMNYPRNPPELLVLYGVSLLMIIPVLATYNSPSNQLVKLAAVRKKVRPGWMYIIITLLMLIASRMIVFKGISFS